MAIHACAGWFVPFRFIQWQYTPVPGGSRQGRAQRGREDTASPRLEIRAAILNSGDRRPDGAPKGAAAVAVRLAGRKEAEKCL
ncbi:hypothetical protein NDU88_001525 [Pleurodeles waltl]|uniref:Uncharacterized protein n=1 Tax=Pleurodeles waltl TaxID=8319 RepID=A0AAV7TKD3_PLEWA|nr:hypothetical protein NDU88_001525 [Pleurodeles waltl]